MTQKLKRTNSKDYTDRMESFLLEAIDNGKETSKGKINLFFLTFEKCTNYAYNLHRYLTRQNRLADYLQGLPSDFSIPFYNYDILNFAKEIHEVDSLTEKQEKTILENYWSHIAFHLIRLHEKFNK